MRAGGKRSRRLAGASLAIVLVLCVSAPGQAALPVRTLSHLRAAGRGTLVEGPCHSLAAIRRSPVQYSAMLLTIAVAGAGAKFYGIDPAPYAIGISALATGWSAWRAIPMILAASPIERSGVIGREILWPVALSAGTTVAGHYGIGTSEGQHAVNAKVLAKTGAQSAVIGFDVPTIIQTVLDTERNGAHRDDTL